LGESHPLVAVALNSLSRVLRNEGRDADAAAALEAALNIARPALGSDHQLVAIYTLNLAAVELSRKNPARAEALIRDGLRIRLLAPRLVPNRRRIFPEDDWSITATKSLLGASLVAERRYDEAESVLLDARRELQASPAPSRRDLDAVITRLIELYEASSQPDKAALYRAQLGS
jgi:tetratricopeptide (TPR) repeat protein